MVESEGDWSADGGGELRVANCSSRSLRAVRAEVRFECRSDLR